MQIFDKFCEDWLVLKQTAVDSDSKKDWERYKMFLEEVRKYFSKAYLQVEDSFLENFISDILKTVSCELKEINIKYKR